MDQLYEKWTDRARKVMQLAHQEAWNFNHTMVDTHHVLLALIREKDGLATHVLKECQLTLIGMRAATEKIFPRGSPNVNVDRLPKTDELRLAIKKTREEAHVLDHNFCGAEHLLLGILKHDTNAVKVLNALHINPDEVRRKTLYWLGYAPDPIMTRWIAPEESLEYAAVVFPPEYVCVYSVACTKAVARM